MGKSYDLDLGHVNVDQSRRSWLKPIAHGSFFIHLLPLTQSLYLSSFSKYLMLKF